jgi:8-oxo-dGTP pyrophosphatase MutT (NUDIX family)
MVRVDKVEMVVGFLFTVDRKDVVLIRKTKPEWQKGFLNGVGGKVEPGEVPEQAMQREFAEETTLDVAGWEYMGDLEGPTWRVTVYRNFSMLAPHIESTTEEIVGLYPVDKLAEMDVIANLRWIIPYCLDEGTKGTGGPGHFSVQY